MSGENERRRRNDDSELPRISVTRTATTDGSEGTNAATASPLLVLLDGVLSRDEARVSEAMHIILHEYKVVINATTATKSTAAIRICHHRSSAIQSNYDNEAETTVDISRQQNRQPTQALGVLENRSTLSGPSSNALLRHALDGIESPCTSSASLCIVINALLNQYPYLAQIPSDHDGSLPLHFAASLGNVPVAISILQKYPQAATKPNQKGKIPLHYGAREGRVDMVKYFLHVCPETCTIATDKGKLAIHFAAGDGHAEITSALLQAYPKSAAISSHKGKLPLHFCARWGYMEIALQLVSIYPEAVKARDWEGSLPLHDAAREGEYQMAKFLMNRYPKSLQVANLRCEIPLLPAIRSSKLDLVALMLQAWPMSGKYVLRNVGADDHISSWHWNILELLLRGATNNFHKCSLLENRERPSFCLLDDVEPLHVEAASLTSKEKRAQKKARKVAATTNMLEQHQPATELGTVSFASTATKFHADSAHNESYIPTSTHASLQKANDSMQRLAPCHPSPPFPSNIPPNHVVAWSPIMIKPSLKSPNAPLPASSTTLTLPIVRCKSPILEMIDEPKMKAKRVRKNDSNASNHPMDHRTFMPIHAAFECKATYQVIERVLEVRPYDVHRSDDWDRNVLHLAVAHCHDPAIVELILEPNNYILTSKLVRVIDRTTGRLPLHIAIANTADVRIIKALLHHYPTSGITPCRTLDEFYDKTPIHMATHFNCDVSTVYELLRIDPSFVLRSRWCGSE
jgi:ankyrin repeat protein